MSLKVEICKWCKDPVYCQSILEACEREEDEGIARLEDERQSEEFYKNLSEE